MKYTLWQSLMESNDSNFNKWFSGSKIIDSNGRPITAYHTSNNKFSVFDPSKASRTAIMGPGIYLTEDKEEAKWGSGETIALYVRALNPINLREYPGDDVLAHLTKFLGRDKPLDSVPLISLEKRYGSISEGLRAAGYDAILHYGPSMKKHILVFESNQLKSVNKNDGGFDGSNPDIYK